MIEQPDWSKKVLTYREILDPAMEVKTQEEAANYFENYVSYLMKYYLEDRKRAEEAAKVNIGYWAGYYSSETATRVYDLFGFGHPIFGRSRPSFGEALTIGKRLAERMKGP